MKEKGFRIRGTPSVVRNHDPLFRIEQFDAAGCRLQAASSAYWLPATPCT